MRSFKKIAAMIMAVAMLCSFTAFAATVSEFTVANTSTAVGENIAIVKVGSDAAQNTILAYKGTAPEGANVVYIDQLAGSAFTSDGVSFELGTNASDAGIYTVVVGGTDVTTAQTATFNHADATPKYNVSVAEATNGTVSWDVASLENLDKDARINFTLVPYFGYKLTSLMVNGEQKEPAVEGGVFTLVVTADTTIVPVFDREEAYESAEAYTYTQWFDVEEAEDEGLSSSTDENGETIKYASKVFFGKSADSSRTVLSRGMELYVKDAETGDYVGFTTKDLDTKFAANPAKVAAGKYGVRFYAFSQGDYKVRSYVTYEDGEEYGEFIYFTVE